MANNKESIILLTYYEINTIINVMIKKEKGKPKTVWSIRIEPELLELLQLKRKEKGKKFAPWIRSLMWEATHK